MTATQKAQIDAMSREELARLWRQAPIGHPLLAGSTGKYFKHVFFERHGGFTPALSKRIGLDHPCANCDHIGDLDHCRQCDNYEKG